MEWRGGAREDNRRPSLPYELAPDPSIQETLAALVEWVAFHNPENAFCVLRVHQFSPQLGMPGYVRVQGVGALMSLVLGVLLSQRAA